MANWDKIKSRGRVIDRRSNPGRTTGRIGLPGGLGRSGGSGIPIPLNGLSLKTLLILGAVYVLFTLLTSGSSFNLDNPGFSESQVPQTQTESSEFAGEDSYEVFVSTVLGSANDMWTDIFNRNNLDYREPKLVLFRNATSSGCGVASSASGPHYCPIDETIYIDETFFDEVLKRFGSEGGDVAEAYIIGHEVAHHAQHLLGYLDQLNQARSAGASNVNDLSVQIELQADCFSGLWAHSIKDLGVFEFNEIEEAMSAAAAVGDDRIQETTTGRVNPESWTHGSSEERVQWFNTGFVTGELTQCSI